MIKSAVSLALTLTLLATCHFPTLIAAQHVGEISGRSVAEGRPVIDVTVRLRDVDSGQLVGQTMSNANGEFRFKELPPGNFVVETVAANGTLLGTSARISLGAMIANAVIVPTSAAAATAAGIRTETVNDGAPGAGGNGVGGAPTPAAAGSFSARALRILAVTGMAVVVAIAAVAAQSDCTPSQ